MMLIQQKSPAFRMPVVIVVASKCGGAPPKMLEPASRIGTLYRLFVDACTLNSRRDGRSLRAGLSDCASSLCESPPYLGSVASAWAVLPTNRRGAGSKRTG